MDSILGGEFKDLPRVSKNSAPHGARKKKRKRVVVTSDIPPSGVDNVGTSTTPNTQVPAATDSLNPPPTYHWRLKWLLKSARLSPPCS